MLKGFILIFLFSIYSFGLSVGEQISEIKSVDQYDKPYQVNISTKYVIFVRDKAASQLAEVAMKSYDKNFFIENNIVYIADVSGMPGFVLSWFARPKMKKYEYRVLLDTEPQVTKNLPSKKDQVTVMTLNQKKVESIEYFNEAKKLNDFMGKLKTESPKTQ